MERVATDAIGSRRSRSVSRLARIEDRFGLGAPSCASTVASSASAGDDPPPLSPLPVGLHATCLGVLQWFLVRLAQELSTLLALDRSLLDLRSVHLANVDDVDGWGKVLGFLLRVR